MHNPVSGKWLPVTALLLAATPCVAADSNDDELVTAEEAVAEEPAPATAVVAERRADEASLAEDPEEQRRARGQQESPAADDTPFKIDTYSSIRVHAINTFNLDSDKRTDKISDGNSRFGFRADYNLPRNWEIIGRAEFGIDLVERFSTRGKTDGDGGLTDRLFFIGVDHEYFAMSYGRNWSAYYKVAGITDRFAIFGGSASGTYNAGTGGENMGTGRAPNLLQARVYVDGKGWLPGLKPFNLNLQYQQGQAIPGVPDEKFEHSYGASAWLEGENELGIGIAYNRAVIPDLQRPGIVAAGIDDDASALAIATRAFGDRWYVGVLYSRLENMEATEQGRYYDAQGVELYAQWEFRDSWWLVGGFNGLYAEDEDPDAGEVRTEYTVIGGRYSFDSFHRMLYFEYRFDNSKLANGLKGKNELTFGVRWDFGY